MQIPGTRLDPDRAARRARVYLAEGTLTAAALADGVTTEAVRGTVERVMRNAVRVARRSRQEIPFERPFTGNPTRAELLWACEVLGLDVTEPRP